MHCFDWLQEKLWLNTALQDPEMLKIVHHQQKSIFRKDLHKAVEQKNDGQILRNSKNVE